MATRRQQRRARRAQQTGEQQQQPQQPTTAQRARTRQQQIRPAAQPVKQQTGRREPAQRGRFVRESWAELKKVEWPGRNQLVQGTVVVIIAVAIVGTYLWLADLAFKNLVQKVLI